MPVHSSFGNREKPCLKKQINKKDGQETRGIGRKDNNTQCIWKVEEFRSQWHLTNLHLEVGIRVFWLVLSYLGAHETT